MLLQAAYVLALASVGWQGPPFARDQTRAPHKPPMLPGCRRPGLTLRMGGWISLIQVHPLRLILLLQLERFLVHQVEAHHQHIVFFNQLPNRLGLFIQRLLVLVSF